MKDGFVKACAMTTSVVVADVKSNVKYIIDAMKEADEKGSKITVFPELCISGYSCSDLFFQDRLLEESKSGLLEIADASKNFDGIYFVGLPFEFCGRLYNVAAAVSRGEILGLVPKRYIPNYNEFYEARQFEAGFYEVCDVKISDDVTTTIGINQFFCANVPQKLVIAVEICEDLWAPNPPSVSHAQSGANVIVNLSASNELTGKSDYRRSLVANQSARLYAGYIYAGAGMDESTQDVVYSGHNIIAENGRILAESKLFSGDAALTELDIDALRHKRRVSTYDMRQSSEYVTHDFMLIEEETYISRFIDPKPFVPSAESDLKKRCEEILDIASFGLRKRLKHTGAKNAVIGISGGLDSTLALLITTRAFDSLDLDRSGIYAITMPGFGTTDRTYQNAVNMIKSLGATFKEISIVEAVKTHFNDIGHDINVTDVTYENSQARERTQILMDFANSVSGLVIGTGDLSELALGWATYNGDHMSMYGVNASIPKTLVRHLVRYYADNLADSGLQKTLYDVLDTPVSPELLPPSDGDISQKTEDLVGPYELHDFFLYYVMRYGFSPKKIYRMAVIAFEDEYDRATILKWLKTFYRRFFAQQFKRSCLPDGPKVGTVSLSPRGDLRMPSDASAAIWLSQLEEIQ